MSEYNSSFKYHGIIELDKKTRNIFIYEDTPTPLLISWKNGWKSLFEHNFFTFMHDPDINQPFHI